MEEIENTDNTGDNNVICTKSSKPVSKKYAMDVGALKNFLVEFTPTCESKIAAELRVTMVNNPFEDNVIQLIGEGYKESVTIDNIHCHDNMMTSQQQLRASSAIEFDGDEVISK